VRTRIPIGLGIIAIAGCYVVVDRSQTDGIIDFYRDTLSTPTFGLWLAGLAAATISAPACAVIFWFRAKRARHGWILHLILVPTMYALFQASAALMLFAAGEHDLDSLTGQALLPATLLLALCPLVYFVSLGVRKIVSLGRRR